MTESNQGPATPGTAARCEICGRDDCDVFRCPDDYDHREAVAHWAGGFERLKAENASLLESLREARQERDKARGDLRSLMPVMGACKASETMEWVSGPDGFSDAVCRACGWRGGILADGRIFAHLPPLPDPALAVAEKERDEQRKRADMNGDLSSQWHDKWDAAEQRNTALEGALRKALANTRSAGMTGVSGEGAPDRCRACLAADGHAADCWVPLARTALHDEERPEQAGARKTGYGASGTATLGEVKPDAE